MSKSLRRGIKTQQHSTGRQQTLWNRKINSKCYNEIPSRHWTCGFIHDVSLLCRIHIECLNDWDKMRTEWLLSFPPSTTMPWTCCRSSHCLTWIWDLNFDRFILAARALVNVQRKEERMNWDEIMKMFFFFTAPAFPPSIPLFFSCDTSNNSHVFHRRQDSSHTQHTAAAAHGYRPIVEGLKWGLASDLCSIEKKESRNQVNICSM